MAHEIAGFTYNKETGEAVPGAVITVILKSTGLPVPVGGEYGGTANPTVSDGTGFFAWSCELSPGPVRVTSSLTGGTEIRVRSGEELMQAGSYYSGDVPVIVQSLSSGVIKGLLEDFLVEAVTGQRKIRVHTGAALAAGNLFSMDADREITIDANPSIAIRRDIVVLNQWVGTSEYGKQTITVEKGTVSATDPTLNSDPDILQIPLQRVIVNQNATSVTTEDMRSYVGPSALPNGIVTVPSLGEDVLDLFEDSVGVGKYEKTVNFNGTGAYVTVSSSDTAVKTLASGTLTLPAGKWLIEARMDLADALCTVNNGTVRFKLAGNGAPVAPDNTTRPIRFSGNVFRPASVSSRLIVNPTTSTTYTVTATAQWEAGDPVRLYGGNLAITAR
jgi:hypothetical protein